MATVPADASLDRPTVDRTRIEAAVREILLAIGEDPEREGLRDTPARVARAWAEFVGGGEEIQVTCFDSVAADQIVAVSGIRVWSFCEHHLLPFWCDVTIGYLPKDRLLGLSKFARIARGAASRLQVQERLIEGIADAVAFACGTPNVAVLGQGEHLCLSMRGAKAPGHRMTTSVLRGVFRDDPAVRSEFFHLATARPQER